MAKKIHYEVELKKSYELEIVPVEGSIQVRVEDGALVIAQQGGFNHVLRVFAPGEWTGAKRVEAD